MNQQRHSETLKMPLSMIYIIHESVHHMGPAHGWWIEKDDAEVFPNLHRLSFSVFLY
jgi:hypothetical protein